MLNTETVRALVSAFNVNNYARDTVKTNFTLQSRGGEDCVVVSFDKGMKDYQCSEYLYNIKRKIVGEFYGIEERDTDEVVLNTAKLIFDVKSFPFNIYKGFWSVGKHGGFEFAAPVDQGVIFNLKSHLASSLKKDVLADMRVSSTTIAFKEKKYLWHDEFDNKELCKQFEREFLSSMKNRYGYRDFFNNPLEVKGNSVYIKDVFDDARFIDNVTRHVAWLIGRDLQADSKNHSDVRAFKDLIMEIPDPSTHVVINAFLCASPLNREEASILIPVILSNRGARFLTTKEAGDINHKFSNPVLDDISDKTQATLKVNGSNIVYGIDFSNKEISHCVITKVIESSVINKDHELSIDPELRLQALSPSSPTPPPTPVPNGPSSSLTESSPTQGFPTRSQGGALKESARRGSGTETEKETVLHNYVSLAVAGPSSAPSAGPSLWPQSGPSSSRGAAQNVSAWTSQPIGAWSSSAPSAGFSSRKGAAQNVSAWTSQPIGFWSSPPPSAEPSLCQPSRPLSRKGADESGSPWPIGYWSPLIPSSGLRFQSLTQLSSSGPIRLSIPSPRPQPYARLSFVHSKDSGFESSRPASTSSSSAGFSSLSQSRLSSSRGAQAGANISEKEKELIEALLYTLNLMNYTLDGVYTNFFAKDGKIISLLHDNVDRKEYLQAVINYIMKEYCGDEEEASKVCDLDEFPFKFFPDPDYKKNQNDYKPKKTVVANISSGALSNLKILFSQMFGKNVDAIDINCVKEVEKHEKEKWVGIQLKDSTLTTEEAIKEAVKSAYIDCFPDEGAMKIIPIALEEGEYVLDRSRDPSEVRSLRKALPPLTTKEEIQCFLDRVFKTGKTQQEQSQLTEQDTSVAEKRSIKAEERTSDYYSMSEHTDHEKSLPIKRTLELSMGMKELAIATDLNATKAEQHSQKNLEAIDLIHYS